MAEEVRGRMNRRLGPDVGEVRAGQIPLPVLVPLADGASPGSRPPLVMYGILFLTVALHLLSWIGAGDMTGLQGRLALPSRGDRPARCRMPFPLRAGGQRGGSAGAGSVPLFLSFLRRGRGCGARR